MRIAHPQACLRVLELYSFLQKDFICNQGVGGRQAACEPRGRPFESVWAHHLKLSLSINSTLDRGNSISPSTGGHCDRSSHKGATFRGRAHPRSIALSGQIKINQERPAGHWIIQSARCVATTGAGVSAWLSLKESTRCRNR